MQVKDFILWLEKQEQEAYVEVIVHSSGTGYHDQGGNISVEEFDITEDKYDSFGKHWEYTDFRGNKFVEEAAPHFNKRFSMIGGRDN